ncbi:MAG: outer membrane lipoprotein carrier protein LolA [Planctomycetota bacterium]
MNMGGLLLMALLALPLQGQEDPVPYSALTGAEQELFLKEMGAALKKVQSLRADFVQERHVSLFLDPLESRGICSFERPDRLRWEVVKPYASLLILNGRGVAKFDRVEGELRKMKLGGEDLLREVLGQITDWIQGDFSRADEMYALTLEKGADFRLRMQPRSEKLSKMIRAVELFVDPETHRVTKVVIREPGEDYLEIRFEQEQLNIKFDPSTFSLDQSDHTR